MQEKIKLQLMLLKEKEKNKQIWMMPVITYKMTK